MEFIIANAKKMEMGNLPESFSVDFDIGDTNDVEIIFFRLPLQRTDR